MEIINRGQTPNKGDVIWAFRFSYFHCGIYIGDNSVIHFAPQENNVKLKESTVIHISSLEEFAGGFSVSVIEFPSEKCFSPDEVVSRACSRLNKNDYNLTFNNCDHFAIWCKTSKHHSTQVDFVKELVIAVCKAIDNSVNKKTEFAKYAKIASKIHEIMEIIISTNSAKEV